MHLALSGLSVALLTAVMLFAVAPGASADDAQRPAATALDIEALTRSVGWLYRLDPDLLLAIARAESRGNPRAVSPKGALGLMQLMPDTASRFGVRNPFDPAENMMGAARFLNELKGRQWNVPGAPLAVMLAAYNAGPGAVEKYGGVPPYPETREYISRVLRDYLQQVTPRAQRHFDSGLAGDELDHSMDPHQQLFELRRGRMNALKAARLCRDKGPGTWTASRP